MKVHHLTTLHKNIANICPLPNAKTDRTPPAVRPKPLLQFILKATKLTMSLGNSSNTFYVCLFIGINRLQMISSIFVLKI